MTRIAVTSNVIPLIARRGKPLSRQYLTAYHSRHSKRSLPGEAPINSAQNGIVYLTPISFGNQSFLSVLDTGSADTWLVDEKFSCLDVYSRKPLARADCKFGPAFDSSASPSFKQVPDQHFNITYGDGEFLTGVIGNEDVTLAGIKVRNQTVAVVDYGAWTGDTKSSGLIGLAYPFATRAYTGNITRLQRRGVRVPYDPIFTTMWKKGLTAPLFSVALGRTNDEQGVLAMGGLPGYPIKYESTFVSTPIEYTTITSTLSINASTPAGSQSEYILYTIKPDNFAFAPQNSAQNITHNTTLKHGPGPIRQTVTTHATNGKAIIDTGTTLIFVPDSLANKINACFTPPSRFDRRNQAYLVDCNAAPPRLGLTISGTTFWMDPKELVQKVENETFCLSAVQDGGNGTMIVGDVWMKSVVSVFDVGAAEMRFAKRL
ncbi:aspartic peptidase domain-containing protein [Venturia nashicola]|uniref:Aspartic peptidase domain-containing protein n=1 Tax=Venturia nashicola TaxID=86259 RepID=A0A4Z1PQM9_9PEZI|nr:aspartic peptidase domain-containing protein [Venturia nashicola]